LARKQYQYFSNPSNGYINGEVIIISSSEDIANYAANGGIQPGDLLYFAPDGETVHHATIITKVDNNKIYYAGHTNSAFDKPLSEGIGNDTVFIVRIRDDA
jgi:cell wall-associated NlpC family hydrolase